MFWSDSLDCVRQVEGREYANDMSSPSPLSRDKERSKYCFERRILPEEAVIVS